MAYRSSTSRSLTRGRATPRRSRPHLVLHPLENRVLLAATPYATLDLIPPAGGSATAVSLAVGSYAFGFANAFDSGTGGGGAGRIAFDDLTVTTPLASVSPAFLAAVAAADTVSPYATAVLTQRDAAGAAVAQWVMGGVNLAAGVVSNGGGGGGGGDAAAGVPAQTLHVGFRALTEATAASTRSWDAVRGNATGPAAPVGVTLAPLPVPPAAPPLTLTLQPTSGPAVTLALDSYEFGAVRPASATAIDFRELAVTTRLSAASPGLFAALAAATYFPTATLTQADAAGRVVAAWVLGTVRVASDAVTADAAGVPTERLGLTFRAATAATSTGATSWNRQTNNGSGPAAPPGLVTAPLPAVPAAPPVTLQFLPSGSGLPAVTVPLDSYRFGYADPAGGATGAPAGVAFDELVATGPLADASRGLLRAIGTGNAYPTAVLTQRNPAGQVVAQWALGTVLVTYHAVRNGGAGDADVTDTPAEEIHVSFGAMTAVTAGQVASWNAANNTPTGPAAPAGVTLVPLPSAAAAPVTLDLIPPAESGGSVVSLAIGSYAFGFANAFDSGTGGGGAGRIAFDDLTVTTPLAGASPAFLAAVAAADTASPYATAVLTQRDAAGAPIAQWVMGGAGLSAATIASGAGAAGVPVQTLHVSFRAVTEATATNAKSWDRTRGLATGPAAPVGAALAPLPAPPANPAVTLTLQPTSGPAVTLALDSYEFGAAYLTTTTGSRLEFRDLVVTGRLSAASPDLFAAVAAATYFPTATLTQADAAGHVVAAWVLGTVRIEADAIAGGGAGVPTERLGLEFRALTAATSTGTTSWNRQTNNGSGPAAPPGLVTAPLPAVPAAPPVTLQFLPSGSGLPAVTVPLDSYRFGYADPAGGATGAPAGVAFDELVATGPLADASRGLLRAIGTGNAYPTAVLTQRNPAGQVVAQWALGTVLVTYHAVRNGGAGDADVTDTPAEEIHVSFGAMTAVTAGQVASWNTANNTATGPAAPAGITVVALPTGPSDVRGRRLFYNHSPLDGNDPGAGPADDAAVAADKAALLPGQAASAANVSGYARGINGVMIDLALVASGGRISAADLDLRVGTTGDPAAWAPAPAPLAVALRRGAGAGGSDRLTITWADGAITSRWLRVALKANARTGLGAGDVFYFGSLPGDADADGSVDFADLVTLAQRYDQPTTAGVAAGDLNVDGVVDFADLVALAQGYDTTLAAPAVGAAAAAPLAVPAAATPAARPPRAPAPEPARKDGVAPVFATTTLVVPDEQPPRKPVRARPPR
jgi:type VI protein secretion system component Hcp